MGLRDPKAAFIRRSRRGRFAALALLPIFSMLIGCGEDIACSSSGAQQLVERIARDKFKSTVDSRTEVIEGLKIRISDIITTNKDSAKAACKAKLQFREPDIARGKNEFVDYDLPITYTVEKTDDGRLYVTIYGL